MWFTRLRAPRIRTLRRIAAAVNVSNAVVIAFAQHLSPRPEHEADLYAGVAAVMLGNAIVLLIARRWPPWLLAAVAIGVPNVVVLTLVMVTSYVGSLPMLLLWSALASPYFRSRATAVGNLAVIAAGMAIAVLVSPDPRMSWFTWVLTVLACTSCSITVRMIAEHNEALVAMLNERAERDQLTGLLNRRGFDERLDAAWDEDGELVVAFFDLDNFKTVNDVYGHPAGDAVLQAFAKVLNAHARGADVVGRTGGEEFGLVMPGRSGETALAQARAVIQAFASRPIHVEGALLRCTASAGVAVRGARHTGATQLCRDADRALYAAKDSGRDTVVLHSAEAARPADG